MSSLWPQGNDVTLIKLMGDYLQTLSKNAAVDEATRDSLGVAVDCLSSITESDSVTVVNNNNNLSLPEMYQQCLESQSNASESKSNENKSNEKNENSKNDSSNDKKGSSLSSEELQKRLDKFHQFVKVLKTKNFFKNTKEGSQEYLKLLDTARTQWNQRFPQFMLDSLELITNASTNKELAAKAKGEGNVALQKKDFKTAISRYTEAIRLDPQNAIYYSNRSAAYCYTHDFEQAAIDARKATEVDPKYVKAWVRLGVSEFELTNYEAAQNSYNQALQLTPATDKNWELYMERVQLCEQKLNGGDNDGNVDTNAGSIPSGVPDMSQLGDMLGGMDGNPNLQNMFQNMGGMDGLSKMMENPMMKQMAQNFMKDPSMMQNLQNMMGSGGDGGGGANPMSGMFGRGDDAANGDAPAMDDDMKDTMQQLLADPQKAQEIMKKAMEDDEVKELMGDPLVAPLITRIKDGDYSALMEASKNPELMVKVRKLMKKYT